MKHLIWIFLFALTIAFIHIYSCKKDLDKTYRAPVADAGLDATIMLPQDSFLLDGTGSKKTDLEIASYEWRMIAGPSSALIRSSKSIKAMVVGLKEGNAQFELKVTDALGQIDRDTVEISIGPVPNSAPKADAGADIEIRRPIRSIVLDGRNSSDRENNIQSYSWSFVSGPSSYHIDHPDSSTTVVGNLDVGSYIFELRVTDSMGLFSRDFVAVIVLDIIAGTNQVLNIFCDTVYTSVSNGARFVFEAYVEGLDGQRHYIGDSYNLTQLSGPADIYISSTENLGEAIAVELGYIVKGSYEFELGVLFAGGVFLYDTLRLEVVEEQKKGAEYIFESTWRYLADNEMITAQSPHHPELFFNPGMGKTFSIKLQDSTEWIDISQDAPSFVYYFEGCIDYVSIYSTDPKYLSLAGQKVLIKMRYD